MNRVLLVILIVVGVVFTAAFIGLTYIGAKGPETFIYAENEIPASFKKEMEDLGILEENEHLIYFYSDGLLDIKDGIYALTDQHLIVYSNQLSQPELIIEFGEIITHEIVYDDSFFNDSYVTVETEDGLWVEFPLSSEKGRDKQFYTLLTRKVEEAHELQSELNEE